ncbi:VirB4 family type IV secretion system protein [Haloarchaeobius litoreus]|uniref:VirB4 family type IV secretion system protein n=1 Tax=Haloarchaeobius litoreus TaxID=755306 RepID=A0ABD6DPN7_9EURY|nr:conjugal transfer protein [Haloarchaeobius litoreus]
MSTKSDSGQYSARRIHKSLGGTTAFLRGYSIAELLLFLGVGFTTFVAAALVPATLTIPTFGFGLMLTLLLLLLHKVKPRHLWLTEWLGARLSWAVKNKSYTHGGEDTSEVRYMTRLERVYPFGIERTDGALVGAMRVTPANLSLEDDDAWSKAVQSFSEFVNANIDFPVNIYTTSRTVDRDDLVHTYRERLRDGDVQSRPVLKRLLQTRIEENTDDNGEPDSESTTVREFYIITAVTDADIEADSQADDSVVTYLSSLPVVGSAFGRFQTTDLSAEDRDQLKQSKLESRLAQIRRGGTSLYRCSVSPVDSYELARVTKEYWSCQRETYGDLSNAIGTFPIVSHGISDGVPSTPSPEDVVSTDSEDSPSPVETTAVDDEAEWEFPLDDEETAEDDAKDDSESKGLSTTKLYDSVSHRHQSIVAPSTVDWNPTYAVIDDETFVRTFWIDQFPEEPVEGMFERVLLETDLNTDISIHLDPFDNQSAQDMMADWISDLKVNQHDAGGLHAEDLEDDIQRAKYMRALVRANEASFYRGGVFIRLTAESKDDLDSQTNRLRSLVKDAPSNCTLKVASRWQEKGLATVSPLGRNELGRDRMSTMTNQAVGAMFPFSSDYLMMDDGIEYGFHGHNGSPVRINPWSLETGHSELVVGMPGAGKTFGGTMRHLRMMKRRNDTMLVVIDPVGGFQGIADALDAKTIAVGGDTKLNPLEIRQTPQHVVDADDGISPLSAKKDEVFAVLENFLEGRDITLGAQTGVLSYAIDEAYRQAGVVAGDVSTHTPANSPTMRDVLDVLADISDHPDEHNIAASDSARERATQYADDLAIALQPFSEGGSYENLAKKSEVDILEGDNKVVYIDLGQIEGSASGIDRQTFLMQLLLTTVYQQAKRTDRNVELAIDEAHYLFEDRANLDFLETAFRHQRHAGLRMVLLSQTAQEFYESEQAEKILGMCPIKVFHKLPDLDDETADKIGLTREQRQYIRSADAGKDELGYSESLVRIEEHGTYPVHVVADAFEQRVIDYEPEDQAFIEDAITEVPDEYADFESFVEEQAKQNALTNRYGLSPETADQLLEEGLSADDLLHAVAATAQEKQAREVAPRTDGGSAGGESDG